MWYGRVTAFVGGCLSLSWFGKLFMYLVGLKPAKLLSHSLSLSLPYLCW